jgi:hypothetical protein
MKMQLTEGVVHATIAAGELALLYDAVNMLRDSYDQDEEEDADKITTANHLCEVIGSMNDLVNVDDVEES